MRVKSAALPVLITKQPLVSAKLRRLSKRHPPRGIEVKSEACCQCPMLSRLVRGGPLVVILGLAGCRPVGRIRVGDVGGVQGVGARCPVMVDGGSCVCEGNQYRYRVPNLLWVGT